MAALTIADLMQYAREQARIEACNYFHPRYARAEEVAAWRRDRSRRDSARRQILRKYPGRLRSGEPLQPGRYGPSGRLQITANAIDYTPGQYAPVEIYGAVLGYLGRTNALGAEL
jgi:hypothetical protein